MIKRTAHCLLLALLFITGLGGKDQPRSATPPVVTGDTLTNSHAYPLSDKDDRAVVQFGRPVLP